MNVSTLTMPQHEARTKLREYRAGIHRKADAEWQRAAEAYEQLAAGRPVIIMSQAFANAPLDAQMRPRIALARADRKQVCVRRNQRSGWLQFRTDDRWNLDKVPADYNLDVIGVRTHASMAEGWAMVPMVPPSLGRHDLRKRFILWEVEAWADRRIGVSPDRDPYLLVKVSDDLYAVVGEWDLTDVERAVMASRARQ